MENMSKKEEIKAENVCKEECKTYKKWIKGINESLSSFAVKYFEFDCIYTQDTEPSPVSKRKSPTLRRTFQ